MQPHSESFAKVFESCVLNCLQKSGALITHVLTSGRRSMVEARQDAQLAHLLVPLHNAIHTLQKFEHTLVAAFPEALKKQFDQVLGNAGERQVQKASLTALDSLLLVHENEIIAQVELSRMRQNVLSLTEIDYVTLNTYVCAAQGLSNVRTDTNPFHPESYIRALQQSFEGVEVDVESELAP